jgi:UDP-glucose 4-epimerase
MAILVSAGAEYIGSMTVDYLLWVVLDNLARGHHQARNT